MALADNLIAFWRLDEASGTREDNFGSNDLTDVNTVTQAVGQVGDAAQFTNANSETLTIADNSDLSTGDIDFSLSVWVRLDNKDTSQFIIGKWAGVGDNREYFIWFNVSTSRFEFIVSPDGTDPGSGTATADNLGSPAVATFYHIIAWHDSVANTVNIVVDDGSVDSTSFSGGPTNLGSAFRIGAFGDDFSFLDGRVDAAGFWKKVLSSAERTELNNGGLGIEFPFDPGDFSNKATVTTQEINEDTGFVRELVLPRFSGKTLELSTTVDEVASTVTAVQFLLDEMAQSIEDKFNNQVVTNPPCDVCTVTDGAVVLDCHQCSSFEIVVDADINSITLKNCDRPGQRIDLNFNPTGDFEVTGFPSSLLCPACGDNENPLRLTQGNVFPLSILNNAAGRGVAGGAGSGAGSSCVLSCINSGLQAGGDLAAVIQSCIEQCQEPAGGSGGGGGGALCACVPDDPVEQLLKVVECTQIDCTDPSPSAELEACGGNPPYTWSITGAENATLTETGGINSGVTLTPGPNDPTVAGTAIQKQECCDGSPPATANAFADFGCDDLLITCGRAGPTCVGGGICSCTTPVTCLGGNPNGCTGSVPCLQACASLLADGGPGGAVGTQVDMRTQAMIDQGCAPCALTLNGAVVTVTDSDGTSVATVIVT